MPEDRPIPEGMGRFIGVAALSGEISLDATMDRDIPAGSLKFDGQPAMLTWAPTSAEGHEEGLPVGAITEAQWDGEEFSIGGVFDASELAQELRRQLLEGMPWGLSVEPSKETLLLELRPDGSSKQTLVDGLLTGVLVTKDAALHGTWIKALVDEVVEIEIGAEPEPMVAANYPAFPPADCFTKPDLAHITPVTVEGPRVYGHLAGNGCHRGFPNTCIRIGDLSKDYSEFARRTIPLVDGSQSPPIGQITLTGGHADLRLGFAAAQAHYDDTNSAVADIAVWWDDKNESIVFSGALRPDVTPEQVRTLLASDVSVDYRPKDGERKLAAALSVNTPGFPIPRIEALVASGEVQALIMPPLIAAEPGANMTGGMIALRPADPEALTVEGGDPSDYLHMTLAYVAEDASQLLPEQVDAIQRAGADAAQNFDPIEATVAGYAVLGTEDPPATVLVLNGADLAAVRDAVWEGLEDDSGVDVPAEWPEQQEPFVAHVTLGYGLDPSVAAPFVGQTIMFNRITVDLGGEQTEHPLGATEEPLAASLWRDFETDVLWEDLSTLME